MTLLALLATSGIASGPSTPIVGPPYNAASHLVVPTPDGTGQSTHPSVIDMGADGWNGWRYWMAHTPYAAAAVAQENPCIAVSDDGVTWVEPAGIANPVDPFPGGGRYNSDTELAYDPDTDTMWMVWREALGNSNETIYAASSPDGVTWSAPVELLTTGHITRALSPSLLRIADGDWRLWCIGYNGQPSTVRTATNPAGPWSSPTVIALPVPNGQPWHVDVNYDQGIYRMLLDVRDPWYYLALTSGDGINWTARKEIMYGRAGRWDAIVYRATMTLHENGDAYRVWYGGTLADLSQWWIGHATVPASLWQ